MKYLRANGPDYGYYPKEEKSSIIVSPGQVENAKEVFKPLGCTVATVKVCLGGFIGTRAELEAHVQGKVEEWISHTKDLARAAKRHPQSAYCVFTKSLQAEWTHLQRILPNIGKFFAPLEEEITNTFIPALLGTVTVDPSDGHCVVNSLRSQSGSANWRFLTPSRRPMRPLML